MKKLPRTPRYSTSEILWQRLLARPFKGRPLHWEVRLRCGHEAQLRVIYTRSVTRAELDEFLRRSNGKWSYAALEPRPDFVWVPTRGTEAACRRCPPPSVLDRMASVV